MFTLHPTIEKDTMIIGDLPLCRVLLMNDKTYYWLILVPKRPDIEEMFELTDVEQQMLSKELNAVAERVNEQTGADKINVAALGNRVPQLHIHVIARYKSDPAWPKPVWGVDPAVPYAEDEKHAELSKWRSALGDLGLLLV